MIKVRKTPGFLHVDVFRDDLGELGVGEVASCGVDILQDLPWEDFVPTSLIPALDHMNARLPDRFRVSVDDVERALVS